jgi:hypothetical protein
MALGVSPNRMQAPQWTDDEDQVQTWAFALDLRPTHGGVAACHTSTFIIGYSLFDIRGASVNNEYRTPINE